ncbi:IclR family transcriptional regulator [Bradyrhizobium uaiense]|uniref:IclR family transcriptional regulator n=1 Tax=Bradyrhizobium uaiense TaxID=2594946 RepID=A0A6P1BKA3_9BRAD|nr:IclR family transcriptional regulator [Bradyrhizobium uaiense]NEU98653.1 IclR family transcriptional regulator [Bradyrhizobium uaiense]
MKRGNVGGDLRMSGRVRARPAVRPAAASDALDDGRKGVQSVDIAFSILRALESANRPLSLSELAACVEQQSSKVHHYIVSLLRNGMVAQNAAGHYDLGTFALQIGLSALNRLDAVEQSTQAITAFRDETGEAVFVAVWGNRGPTIIRYVEGSHPVTVEVRAGLVLPLLTSATGHVFLSWLPEAKWSSVADWEKELAARGNDHRMSAKAIQTIQRTTREQRLASIDGDLLPRIAAISAPVFGYDGALVCALTVLGWRGELALSPSGGLAQRLLATSTALSRALGFRE